MIDPNIVRFVNVRAATIARMSTTSIVVTNLRKFRSEVQEDIISIEKNQASINSSLGTDIVRLNEAVNQINKILYAAGLRTWVTGYGKEEEDYAKEVGAKIRSLVGHSQASSRTDNEKEKSTSISGADT